MAWYDTLGEIISKLPVEEASKYLDAITSSNELNGQINSLLLQVQRNPESASDVATAIIGLKGVPGVIRDLAGGLPQAAKDPSGIALQMVIANIQTTLPRNRWF